MKGWCFQIVFRLGKIVSTIGVAKSLERQEITQLLNRHLNSDWGNVDNEDIKKNNNIVESGKGEIFSSYRTIKGAVWIITDMECSVTTIMLAKEH